MAAPSPVLHVKPGTERAAVLGRARVVAPETNVAGHSRYPAAI